MRQCELLDKLNGSTNEKVKRSHDDDDCCLQ